MKKLLLTTLLLLGAWMADSHAQTWGNMPPLHVDGSELKDDKGNVVRLHGVMDTPSPYFNNARWGGKDYHWQIDLQNQGSSYTSSCIDYFKKLFDGITDTERGAYCNVFRLHLDPCWTNDNNVNYSYTDADGNTVVAGKTGDGEANIEHFSKTRLSTYLRTLYTRIAKEGIARGLYIVMRPPGVCPGTIQVGDAYHHYLLDVWDIISRNDTVQKYSGQISLELANEPIRVLDANGQSSANALHDFFQPIVDKIRANGFTGIIWSSGTGYQSGYEGYATYPITGYNIGYAVHVYTGWYGQEDNNANAQTFINNFTRQVPVVKTNPIIVTEIDWSPKNTNDIERTNEMGQPVYRNFGTWATGSTSKWGMAWKAVHDYYGNIGMTLTSTGDFIDIDKWIYDKNLSYASWKTNKNRVLEPAFLDKMKADGYEDAFEACSGACMEWYKDWNTTTRPYMAYKHQWTADQGNGTFKNPVINADFPDIDVIRVDDTFYMVSTTMFYFPGATILKSKDLVNWEYCANPLQQVVDNDAYNLLGSHHYAQGMWASTLNYHNGRFYLYFPCSTWSPDSRSILLTASDPEGTWEVKLLPEAYHDPGWLFDDGKDGDGFLYVACGIGDIWVHKFNPNTITKLSSTKVISVGNGLEGSHMYHIGDYYYIYATYGGTEGSQTIFRSKSPTGPYEECVTATSTTNPKGRIFAGQKIHQGALVDTPTGEWWTMLFKDDGAIGRIPYLEPVTWTDGWPVIGNNGTDVTAGGKAYAMPNVGQRYERKYLPTNDTFTDPRLGMQWEWNHNPVEGGWSLIENPGYLRLHTVSITDSLQWARNSLSQRIIGYNPVGTTAARTTQSYGTIKLSTEHMTEGDVAGLAIFQEPYQYIGVKVIDGQRRLYSLWQKSLQGEQREVVGDVVEADTIYLRAIANFNTSKANFYYSYDNRTYTQFGPEMTMAYTLGVFVGNRFFLFNYATKQLGGYVDIDWFSTEPEWEEEWFYGPGTLHTYTEADLTVAEMVLEKTDYSLIPGGTMPLEIISTSQSGLVSNVAANCKYEFSNPDIAQAVGGNIRGLNPGETDITATYTDPLGNSHSVTMHVTVDYFPLTADMFNPSIYGSGTFTERSKSLKTSQYGFGGWEYNGGVDLSAYNYLVVKLRVGSTAQPSFRLFDSTNYWSDCYQYNMKTATTAVIDLHNLVTPNGRTIDPAHIYKAGFWTDGTRALYINEVFLSMDGENPVGIHDVKIAGSDASTAAGQPSIYNLQGQQLSAPQRGINIIGGKKVLVK